MNISIGTLPPLCFVSNLRQGVVRVAEWRHIRNNEGAYKKGLQPLKRDFGLPYNRDFLATAKAQCTRSCRLHRQSSFLLIAFVLVECEIVVVVVFHTQLYCRQCLQVLI